MKTILAACGILMATYAAADDHYEVTCYAEMRHKETGGVVSEYIKTRGGGTLDWARDLAEENVMEACTQDLIILDREQEHDCIFLGCSQ